MDTITKVSVNGTVYNLGGTGGGSSTPVQTTYSELVALRDGGNLVAGQKYRITDYTAAFKTLKSAGHKFDIVVEALSASTLSEKASALPHEGDDYFSKSSPETWELWYSLDNDTSRFPEASEQGKGYIYRMKDEYGNDVAFDFKNALFTLDKEDFTFLSADSLDFYLFSYHTGTAGDFSSQDNIVDFSTYKPSSVHHNTVRDTNSTGKFRMVILMDKYTLDAIGYTGKVYGNTIYANDVVVACQQIATYISGNAFHTGVLCSALAGNIQDSTFTRTGGTKIAGSGSFLNTKVAAANVSFSGQYTVEDSDIAVDGDGVVLAVGGNLTGCTVRVAGSATAAIAMLQGAHTNKLIYGKGEEAIEMKYIDPMELA